jgi:cytochrome c biogenesis protein CcmG, thiol:disulfide interchange protein DsbE
VKRSAVPITVAALAVALIALLVYGVVSKKTNDTLDQAVRSGKKPSAPGRDVALPNLAGPGTRRLADLNGKVVVLNFWASWCPPCKGEAPILARWQPRLRAHGGTIVGVDVLDVSSDAQHFVAEHRLAFPHLRDADGSRLKAFEVVGYPETIVLDRRGRIAATSRGAIDDRFFTTKVEPLLKEQA